MGAGTIYRTKNPMPEIDKLFGDIEMRLAGAEATIKKKVEQKARRIHFNQSDIEDLYIFDRERKLVKFILNTTQTKILNETNDMLDNDIPVRLVIHKSRKHGTSTLMAAFVYLLIRDHHYKCTIVGHERRSAENLYKMIRLFWSKDPAADKKPEIRNKRELIFSEGGEVWVASADVDELERSQSCQVLIFTEYAFYPRPEKAMTAATDTVGDLPGTFIIIESTANGPDNDFHNRWKEAEAGVDEHGNKIPWRGIFLSWWENNWNRKSFKNNDNIQERIRKHAHKDEIAMLDEGISPEAIHWRRRKILTYSGKTYEQKRLKFYQEHPSTPDEAFLNTGRKRFARRILHRWYDEAKAKYPPIFVGDITSFKGELRWHGFAETYESMMAAEAVESEVFGFISTYFTETAEGDFKIWEWPERGIDYEIGADVALGVEMDDGSNDSSAFHVMRRDNGKFIMRYKSAEIKPEEYAELLSCIGFLYNEAYVCIETNSMGYTTTRDIQRIYPMHRLYFSTRGENVAYQEDTERCGFWSAEKTKRMMINRFDEAIREETIRIYDLETIGELIRAVIEKDGSIETNGRDLLSSAALTLESHAQAKDYQKKPVKSDGWEEYVKFRESQRTKAETFQAAIMGYGPATNYSWEIPA